MSYHWVEWDMWDKRTRRYAVIEKKILFEKNKKNGMVSVEQAYSDMIEKLWQDIDKWNRCKGVYDPKDEWRPEVKILDGVAHRTKLFDIIGKDGEMISFGHTIFEIHFSVKLPK